MSEDQTLSSWSELKDIVQDIREPLSQSLLAFLLGAGWCKNAGLPLMPELTKELLVHDKICEETKKLLDTVRKPFAQSTPRRLANFSLRRTQPQRKIRKK